MAEATLWQLLRGRKLGGAKFRRQHRIDNYIADFACVEARVVIEIDGRSHDVATQAVYDTERTRRLAQLGWRELRVRDDEVLSDPAAVASRIAAMI